MSKSLGNGIDPYDIIEKYGVEPTRYYLLSQIPTLDDGDFTEERFKEVYQANLANGLGNLVARVAAMAQKAGLEIEKEKPRDFSNNVSSAVERFELDNALALIWANIKDADILINKKKVWTLKGEAQERALKELIEIIRQIACDIAPFLPLTRAYQKTI